MTAMGAEHDIFMIQMGTHASGDGFFANVGMAGSVDQSALVGSRKLFFALADDLHLAIQRQHDFGRESIHGVNFSVGYFNGFGRNTNQSANSKLRIKIVPPQIAHV